MGVKLLAEHLLKVLSLKGGCTCSSESTLVKIPHCWKSHVTAQLWLCLFSSWRYSVFYLQDRINTQVINRLAQVEYTRLCFFTKHHVTVTLGWNDSSGVDIAVLGK